MSSILVTGITGAIGGALATRLARDGHEVRGFTRNASRVAGSFGASQIGASTVDIVEGDAVTGAGIDRALDGIETAYFLIHSMEPAGSEDDERFVARERRAAELFAAAASKAGVKRTIYLGGLVPAEIDASDHLASRLDVEDLLLAQAPGPTALRASIVISAKSRSFRFLVHLIERLPVLALPPWRTNRTAPIDGRDVIEYLVRARQVPQASGLSLDIAGPNSLTYGDLMDRIRELLIVGRPRLSIPCAVTPIASRVAAILASEEHALIGPLMEGLDGDLLPRNDDAQRMLGVRLHSFDAAVERALRDWEQTEDLSAR